MADTILDFFAQFCKTLVVAFWYEDRVVTETFCAMLLGGDSTIYNTLKLVYFLDAGATTRTYILFLNITDNRAETGLTILLSSQFSQQLAPSQRLVNWRSATPCGENSVFIIGSNKCSEP